MSKNVVTQEYSENNFSHLRRTHTTAAGAPASWHSHNSNRAAYSLSLNALKATDSSPIPEIDYDF